MPILLFVWSLGCTPELPVGWEDASPVRSLVQTDCEGSPYEGVNERLEGDLAGDPLQVSYLEAHFRCAQAVEAFWLEEADEVRVLVQPIDMHPKMVAGCDCLYNLDIEVGRPEVAPASVVVFRRWDFMNTPNEPVRVGQLPATNAD